MAAASVAAVSAGSIAVGGFAAPCQQGGQSYSKSPSLRASPPSVSGVVPIMVNAVSLPALVPSKRSSSSSQLGSSFIGQGLSTQLSGSTRAVYKTRRSGSSSTFPAVQAKTAGTAKTYEIEVEKPLGLLLGAKPGKGGGVVVTGVNGNAAKAGIKVGDQVIYTSSFFGDELWVADKVSLTRTAINAKPESVYFVLSKGPSDVDLRRLSKRPAPPRFGRKLSDAQKARATHICLDCGYIYTINKPFDEQPEDFLCPQCQASKKRFARYDPESGQALSGGTPITVVLGILFGAVAVGALAFFGLQ